MSRVTFELTDKSHGDHISADHMKVVRAILMDGEGTVVVPPQAGIFIATVVLPDHLPDVLSALRGPASGEAPVTEADAFYGVRGEGRPNLSRLTDLPSQPTRKVTVIVGALEETEEGSWKGNLFTAYGGPCAPQEPGDPYLGSERLSDSQGFWAEHALSADAGIPIRRVEADLDTFQTPERSQEAAK